LRLLALDVTGLALLRSLRHQNAVIMLGMLKLDLCHDAIACRSRIARELQVFLIHVSRGAADLDVGPRRIECPVMTLLRPSAASP
jgi:hypothetical protein